MLSVPQPRGLQPRAQVGAWRSLVARCVRDAKVGGSNPLAPTSSYCMPVAWLVRTISQVVARGAYGQV